MRVRIPNGTPGFTFYSRLGFLRRCAPQNDGTAVLFFNTADLYSEKAQNPPYYEIQNHRYDDLDYDIAFYVFPREQKRAYCHD